MRRGIRPIACVAAVLAALAAPALAFRAPELTAKEVQELRANFALAMGKLKGPYTENTCVCPDGRKIPIRNAAGVVRVPCKDALFCAAFRAPWAQALGAHRLWIANIFSRDLYLWESFPDHDDLVRGYVLEKYFTDTHPGHKLAQLRSFGGLSGVEHETAASARFFERYLSSPGFDNRRDFLLAYELQKRFYVREDLGQIDKVRGMAVRVHNANPKFKPLRDAIHNQLSAGVIPQLVAFRDQLPEGATRQQVSDIIAEVTKLTCLDETALVPLIADVEDERLRPRLRALLPAARDESVAAVQSLAEIMRLGREAVAARRVSPADARRLVDLSIAAAQVIQSFGSRLVESSDLTVRQYVELLGALTDATYGSGLLSVREREAAQQTLARLLAAPAQPRADFARALKHAERVVEWAQANVGFAFAEVWAAWTLLLPDVAAIRDDIVRGSPLLLYAQAARRLEDTAAGGASVRHEIFGAEQPAGIRALNPGLALGKLRVAPKAGTYTRRDIVALRETPADLEPAAGILTQGEGNKLSHVQLLARALGIPNVVLARDVFAKLEQHDGESVLLIASPGGRVILQREAAMTPEQRSVYEEFTRNTEHADSMAPWGGGQKLHIDRDRIDLSVREPLDLSRVRRADSGRICGPKGAYLGELKQIFPAHVARGVVVPFGAYYEHYRNAPVHIPESLRAQGLARPDERLADFVERTYHHLFQELIPAGRPERELVQWITPRLEIIQHSIRETPLSAPLMEQIRQSLDRAGLLRKDRPSETVGCFVRSDTNVEDLDNFNGAGLNLTIFNLTSLPDIYEGLKEVWSSPFRFRSFAWRQTLIDDPLWVLPSVVILESIPSERSGVLVTADPDTGDATKMIVATSEGVGGAVDGTSAETLLWSPEGVELITLFKSPWRTELLPGGGSRVVAASGKETVLAPDELEQLVEVGRKITAAFAPVRDPSGRPRPWDIEFGFARGKLWLFQCRPFIGNDELKNMPALAALEVPSTGGPGDLISLEERVR